eukprot:scaffold2654_cov84-Skeletonema_dohrnii-CCMP3373.AAC.2
MRVAAAARLQAAPAARRNGAATAQAQVSADFSFFKRRQNIYVGVQYNRERFLTSWRSMIQTASSDKVIALRDRLVTLSSSSKP